MWLGEWVSEWVRWQWITPSLMHLLTDWITGLLTDTLTDTLPSSLTFFPFLSILTFPSLPSISPFLPLSWHTLPTFPLPHTPLSLSLPSSPAGTGMSATWWWGRKPTPPASSLSPAPSSLWQRAPLSHSRRRSWRTQYWWCCLRKKTTVVQCDDAMQCDWMIDDGLIVRLF